MSKKALKSMALALILMAACSAILLQKPCKGQGLGRNYEYVFLIETEQVKNEFEYKDSLIGPVIKARVSYYKPNDEDAAPIQYEDLWFHGWQSLGCRRLNKLDIGSGQIAIEARHRSGFGSLQEAEAAAKAILRVFVDLYANKQAVSTIIVPDESFGYILNQMPRAGFNPGPEAQPDVPVYSPIVIPIRTASSSQKQVLYYTTPPDAGGDE